jgi:hypothetical protein
MSNVDNYVLLLTVRNDDSDTIEPATPVARLNSLLGHRGGFVRVDQSAGGRKAFEAGVFLFTGNWFPLHKMAELLLSPEVKWAVPELVRLAHSGQDDEEFTMYGLNALADVITSETSPTGPGSQSASSRS